MVGYTRAIRLIVLLVTLSLFVTACQHPPDRLRAGVFFVYLLRPGIWLTNEDTFDWLNCRLSTSNGYYLMKERISAGSRIYIDPSEFEQADGGRTLRHIPDLTIECDTPEGRKTGGGDLD